MVYNLKHKDDLQKKKAIAFHATAHLKIRPLTGSTPAGRVDFYVRL
jgi:hypothetical protein